MIIIFVSLTAKNNHECLVSMCAVIGQVSGSYSPARTAKI